jgi:hypothetical protein
MKGLTKIAMKLMVLGMSRDWHIEGGNLLGVEGKEDKNYPDPHVGGGTILLKLVAATWRKLEGVRAPLVQEPDTLPDLPFAEPELEAEGPDRARPDIRVEPGNEETSLGAGLGTGVRSEGTEPRSSKRGAKPLEGDGVRLSVAPRDRKHGAGSRLERDPRSFRGLLIEVPDEKGDIEGGGPFESREKTEGKGPDPPVKAMGEECPEEVVVETIWASQIKIQNS